MDHLSYQRLLQEHDEIEMLARRLTVELDNDEAGAGALAGLLRDLVTLVRDHLAAEDVRIYELAARAMPGLAADAVDHAEHEFVLLKANWQQYLELWDEAAIRADRAGFAAASRRMLPRLRDRVRLENDLLVAMALTKDSPPRNG